MLGIAKFIPLVIAVLLYAGCSYVGIKEFNELQEFANMLEFEIDGIYEELAITRDMMYSHEHPYQEHNHNIEPHTHKPVPHNHEHTHTIAPPGAK